MSAYYNEIDPFAASWLRELIKGGHIALGDVDERSIREVTASDLRGYTQHHFFAGIGVWSHALRCADWPDSEPVWTGSCPCQSFSAAGKGEGFSDPRHLWPEWFRLIREHRPVTVFGEQVEAAVRHGWLDLVQADLEGEGYAVGAAVLGAHSVGAPHIRQRLYFVADAQANGRQHEPPVSGGDAEMARARSERIGACGESGVGLLADAEHAIGRPEHEIYGDAHGRDGLGWSGTAGELGDTEQPRLQGHAGDERNGNQPGRQRENEAGSITAAGSISIPVGDPEHAGHREPNGQPTESGSDRSERRLLDRAGGLTHGFWRDAEWLWCRDQKYRPVEPGTFPLAHGTANRVGRLRGYGNALCAPQAEAFIRSYCEINNIAHPTERG